jgi:Fe-S cluster assembly iron-binding protein IscA
MGMALDEPGENEKAVQVNGIDVLIADFIRPFADGLTIDYITHPDGGGFTMIGAGGAC